MSHAIMPSDAKKVEIRLIEELSEFWEEVAVKLLPKKFSTERISIKPILIGKSAGERPTTAFRR